MGQYNVIVNLDKKEFLYPHRFGDGLKLLEFGSSGRGTMLALAVLLANSRNRGGGDLHTDDTTWYGRWAGDSIVIAGDYAEARDAGEPAEGMNLYGLCDEEFVDISIGIINVINQAHKGLIRSAE